MPRPRSGVKVVEIARNLAGPFAREILGRMGADVVSIHRRPPGLGEHDDEVVGPRASGARP
jgi:crotonobetainyl-CoA:carnitine CoA-transferase CaiB-like acyl-CoA transferase